MTIANQMEKNLRSVPWRRTTWHGSFMSLDNTPTNDFEAKDVVECWKWFSEGVDDWDGHCSAIFRLRDGRWVAYESSWGPTGSGFSEDAYGGDANIYFARTKEDAARFGLSRSARKDLKLKLTDKEIKNARRSK